METNSATGKMGTTVFQRNFTRFGGNGQPWGRSKGSDSAKRFHFPLLECKKRFAPLAPEKDRTLMNVLLANGVCLRDLESVTTDDISNELLKRFLVLFPSISVNDIFITQKEIVVRHSLDFTFYSFCTKPFFALKRKAPVLFTAYVSFLVELGFDWTEHGVYTGDFFWVLDDCPKRSVDKAIHKHNKALSVIKDLRERAVAPRKALEMLASYHPKKKLFKDLKKFLTTYIGSGFNFYRNAPYEVLIGLDIDEYYESPTEVYDRIGLFYNDDKSFSMLDNERKQMCFENDTVQEPGYIINTQTNGAEIRSDIEKFEKMVKDYMKFFKPLKKLK